MSIPREVLEREVTLELTPNKRVAIITIRREKKLNAVTQDHYFRIAQLLHDIAAMESVVVTVITAVGRFFSAGADVSIARITPDDPADARKELNRNFVSNNMHNTHAWYSHPKVLVAALNGPTVGLSAALIAHCDFVYAAPHTYLLTPFSSLGLVAEGGASVAFVERLGISKANEALLTSRKIPAAELLHVGFVNKIFDVGGGDKGTGKGMDSAKFLAAVLAEVDDKLGEHLVKESILNIKRLIRKPGMAALDRAGVDEIWGGLDVFMRGVPQKEFAAIASGKKRHKL